MAGQPTRSTARDVRAGVLLASGAELVEPGFSNTVCYVFQHNGDGSLCVALDRPSDTAVRDVLPQWAELAASPQVVFIGGPVRGDAALCLATLRNDAPSHDVPGLHRIDDRVAVVDPNADPAR